MTGRDKQDTTRRDMHVSERERGGRQRQRQGQRQRFVKGNAKVSSRKTSTSRARRSRVKLPKNPDVRSYQTLHLSGEERALTYMYHHAAACASYASHLLAIRFRHTLYYTLATPATTYVRPIRENATKKYTFFPPPAVEFPKGSSSSGRKSLNLRPSLLPAHLCLPDR